MDREQLVKAFNDRTEFEYLVDNQWLPAYISGFNDSNIHSPIVTIQLMTVPSGHSGIIHPNKYDLEHRLRVKGTNK